jgi:diguanylate cyclase (GGDEF)-like protein/putative nucleotidyltransferase with HDIG domain
MTKNSRRPACSYYFFGVAASGLPVLLYAALETLHSRIPLEWLLLGSLTILTALYTVKIPGVNGRIAVADALVFANLILFGTAAGCLTAGCVGCLTSLRTRDSSRRLEYAVFNASVHSLAACLSGWLFFFLLGQGPLWGGRPVLPRELLIPVGSMALAHFLLNSCGVAVMAALELRRNIYAVWQESFLGNSLTCFAGAFAAGLLGAEANSITPAVLGISAAVMLVLYHTYQTYFHRLEGNLTRLQELNKLHLRTVEALGMAIDAKDQLTHGHVRRVQIYARELALVTGISDENELRGIEAAALLHDIGKLAIPEYILNKPGELTRNEFQKMMVHPVVGADILASIRFPYPVADYVRHHHEHWDGSGYPDGLKGIQIPLGARVLAVADCYEALTSDRPYRGAFTRDRALQTIRAKSGKHYDPQVVAQFERILDRLETTVREAEKNELHLEGLDAISVTARGSENISPRRSRDLLVFQDISSTNREVFALYELARTLGSTLNLHETLLIIAGKIEKIVPFTTCVIYLNHLAGDCLRAEHIAGANLQAFKGHAVTLGGTLSGRVAVQNQPAVNADPRADLAPISRMITEEIDNALVYPLNHDGRRLGVISLYAGKGVKFKDDHVRVMEMVSKQAAMAIHNAIRFEETQEDAFTDRLTRLPNSRYLYIYFEQELQKAIRFEYPLTILCMDLDGFKEINDCYGHPVGDRMLVEVARILKTNLRGSDVVVRYAGDEFLAVMSQTSSRDAILLARRVQATLEDFQLEVRPGKYAQVGISIGLASYPSQGDSLESLMIKADDAMYRDKEMRSRRARFSVPAAEPVARQLELKSSTMI